MANLGTHLNVAAVSGSLLAIVAVGEFHWPLEKAAVVGTLVTLGGVLPDIDVDHSKICKGLFSAIGLFVIWILIANWNPLPSTGLLLLVSLVVYLSIRLGGWYLFARYSVHRGLCHSLLATLFFSLVTVYFAHQFAYQEAFWAWIFGLATGTGSLIHLVLDELYSVDVEGRRLKQSFGTALKWFDWRHPWNSCALAAVSGWLIWQAPSANPLLAWCQALWHNFA